MGLNLSFGDVQGFEPIPGGMYTLKIADCPVRENKAKDGEMIVFEFDVQDEEYEGRKVWLNVSLKPQARWKLQEVLEAITQKEWREDDMDLDLEDLLGELVTGEIFIDEYNGRLNNKVNRLYPYEGNS